MKSSIRTSWGNFLVAGAACLFLTPNVSAQIEAQESLDPVKDRTYVSRKAKIDQYILGAGDIIFIEVQDLPEYSGRFQIGPSGSISLLDLNSLYVEGLSIEELRTTLIKEYKAFIKSPDISIRPVNYRPVGVYISGEVRRPGYYILKGNETTRGDVIDTESVVPRVALSESVPINSAAINVVPSDTFLFPTVFDAIRTAQGITPYSNLSKVDVTRKQPISAGGGKIRASVNILSLLTKGDGTQNIRLFDGDIVTVSKSSQILRDQLLFARTTNLSPEFFEVFVSGRVRKPGAILLRQGSSLNQALATAGGLKLLRGKIEFVRFNADEDIDRRIFSYNPQATFNSYKNPILLAGDIVRVRDSLFSAAAEVLGEISAPAIGAYSLYNLIGDFNND